MGDTLVIFAKAPAVGQVKTRLCPPLSLEEAATLARCFLVDLVEQACGLPGVQVVLAITPPESEPEFRALLPFPVSYLAQRGTSLGEREHNVFVDLFHRGATRMVLIGSDIPTLPLAHLEKAFHYLTDLSCDAVFGPSSDGGYYLVGMRALHPELFANISWSTSSVMAETWAQARKHRLHIALVPSWYDVDDKDDLARLVREFNLSATKTSSERTRAFLRQLGFCQ